MTGIARLPEVERLAALRDAAQEDNPVMFVYGPGTDDAFVDTAYRIYGLEEALWESLHAAGFDRIGFYSLTRKLYFRDEESLRAVRPGRPGQAAGQRGGGCGRASLARSGTGSWVASALAPGRPLPRRSAARRSLPRCCRRRVCCRPRVCCARGARVVWGRGRRGLRTRHG